MRGAIPPLPQYVFMAWCSVTKTAQGLYFTYHTELQIYYFHYSFPYVIPVTMEVFVKHLEPYIATLDQYGGMRD
jgi:hypothetical protein